MTSTRIPSEAELIELENWIFREIGHPFHTGYPVISRAEAFERIRALLDLARTVQNP